MDRPMFLNSSGGIVTPYDSGYHWPMGIVPYFETVTLPVISVNSSAIYGDHPENLMTVTYSSGAALTFFVDSVAGGSDTSGNGSFDDPWRSLNTASHFLSCAECMLNTAAPYIQLKVRGTVDYLSAGFNPKPRHPGKLIVAGWGEICDLGSAGLNVGYMFGVKGVPYGGPILSGCVISRCVDQSAAAVNCEIARYSYLSAAYDCSGTFATINVCHGGKFTRLNTDFAYGTKVFSSGGVTSDTIGTVVLGLGLYNRLPGAANCEVVADLTDQRLTVSGVKAVTSALLRSCHVSVRAVADHASSSYAYATAVYGGVVVSGGVYDVEARASAQAASGYDAHADARAILFTNSTAVIVGAATSIAADAQAVTGGGVVREEEREYLANLGSSCYRYVTRYLSSGVVTSTAASSGGVCP